ncbi:MAG TPA: hypothetical protein VFG31_01125 [Conexibacter sp.]|nr:hypothetical protein [Conexibacter sp.]
MFQRIARRHPDHSDESAPADPTTEPVAAETSASAASATDTPAAGADQADGAVPDQGQPTVEVPADDAPTEQIQAVATAGNDQPEAFQAVAPVEQPTTVEPSSPPAGLDETTRLPTATAPPASTPQPQSATAATQPPPVEQTAVTEPAPRRPGFRARGRMRRRLRYLRRLRELQVRDLGGLAFDLRRFERKRDDLIAQKVDQIRACDDELRALAQALDERRDLRDVREPGIGGTCPRCFAIYGSADKFCASCGAALGGAVQGPAQVPLVAATPPPSAPPEAGGPGSQP